MIHAHIAHCQGWSRAQRRNRRDHAQARRQSGPSVAAPVDRLTHQRVGLVVPRGDDHVVGLGDPDLEFVGLDRLDVETVGLDDRHRQSRNPDIEKRHRRGVDEAQPDTFPGIEQAGPVVIRAVPIDQIVERCRCRVRDIGRAHSHAAPHQTVAERRHESLARRIAEEIGQCSLLEVIGVTLRHQALEHPMRALERVVGQHDDVFPVIGDRITAARLDDNRPVMAQLFLQTRMGMVPVCTRLANGNAVGEGLTGLYAGKGDARHAIHLIGKQDAMPVDRRVRIEPIVDPKRDVIAFAPAQQRGWKLSIDRNRWAALPVNANLRSANFQQEFGAGERAQTAEIGVGSALRPGGHQRTRSQPAAGGSRNL